MVTGSSGFVGRHLVKKLKELNHEVLELDKTLGHDLTDHKCLSTFNTADAVIHLAARVFVPESYSNPRTFYYDNFVTTLNSLEFARKNKAKFIYQSSYVYGIPSYLPIDEAHPLAAINPYARTKLICEELTRGYAQDFGMKIIILRPFNIYGPGQDESFLIPKIISGIKSGKLELMDPNPKRDFVFIDDAVEALVKCLSYQGAFSIFNVGSGESYSVKEIVDVVKEISGHDSEIVYSNQSRINEVNDVVCDFSRIHEEMAWQPVVNLENGLFRTIH